MEERSIEEAEEQNCPAIWGPKRIAARLKELGMDVGGGLMLLYLDDDIIDGVLVKLLRKAGHDVMIPADVGLPEPTTRSI